VGGVGCFPRTEISKFHIARYQFAELKIELTFANRHAELVACGLLARQQTTVVPLHNVMYYKNVAILYQGVYKFN